MPSASSSKRQKPGHRARAFTPPGLPSRSWWRKPLVLGILGLGSVLALAYVALNDRPPHSGPEHADLLPATAHSRSPLGWGRPARVQGRARRGDPASGAASQARKRLASTAGLEMPGEPRLPPRQRGSAAEHASAGEPASATEHASAGEPASATEHASARRSYERVTNLLSAKSSDGVLTAEQAEELDRMLQELAEQGTAVAPAVRELLRRVEEGGLAGGDPADQSPMELALQDIESQVGGQGKGVEPLLERLVETTDPMEIAMLAQNLEEEAPGAYRENVLNAAREALARAAEQPPEERVDVAPVFELFEAYGGDEVVADLEKKGQWWNYSLMALAGLPDGQGVPSLAAQARNPAIPIEQRAQLPFQLLAQASAQHPEAGEALVDLARSGQIPDRAWSTVGSALRGMHLEFPLRIFRDTSPAGDGAVPGVEAPRLGGGGTANQDVRYDLRLASANWSAEQVDRQLSLIDELLDSTQSPEAVKALLEAQDSLLKGPRR